MREMKDSGIEWIGTIPFDWKCCKQKYEIQLINGRAYVANTMTNYTVVYGTKRLIKRKKLEECLADTDVI